MTLRLPGVQWTADLMIEWLKGLGLGVGWLDTLDGPDVQIFEGPYIPKAPDELFVLTPTGGAGETMDGIGEWAGFQLLTRGSQFDPVSAQRLALAADRLIRFSPFPMDVAGGELRLARVRRSGGGPSVVPQDDIAERSVLTCNYLTEILR
jgi:hypothetical protein